MKSKSKIYYEKNRHIRLRHSIIWSSGFRFGEVRVEFGWFSDKAAKQRVSGKYFEGNQTNAYEQEVRVILTSPMWLKIPWNKFIYRGKKQGTYCYAALSIKHLYLIVRHPFLWRDKAFLKWLRLSHFALSEIDKRIIEVVCRYYNTHLMECLPVWVLNRSMFLWKLRQASLNRGGNLYRVRIDSNFRIMFKSTHASSVYKKRHSYLYCYT